MRAIVKHITKLFYALTYMFYHIILIRKVHNINYNFSHVVELLRLTIIAWIFAIQFKMNKECIVIFCNALSMYEQSGIYIICNSTFCHPRDAVYYAANGVDAVFT